MNEQDFTHVVITGKHNDEEKVVELVYYDEDNYMTVLVNGKPNTELQYRFVDVMTFNHLSNIKLPCVDNPFPGTVQAYINAIPDVDYFDDGEYEVHFIDE